METLFVIGAGGHSKVVRDAVNPKLFKNTSLLVQEKYLAKDDHQEKLGCIFSFEKAIAQEKRNFICAIGDIAAREKLYNIATKHSWAAKTICHLSSVISKDAIIGDGCYIGANAIINPASQIGQNCIVNTGAIIEHDCEIANHVNISPSATICGKVKIGCNALIGAGSTILPGVEIGDSAIVGAGAVVTSNVTRSTTVIGVPASEN